MVLGIVWSGGVVWNRDIAWNRVLGALDLDCRVNRGMLSNNLIIRLSGTPVLVAMSMTTQVLL